ncbi:Ig-like domain-containing protein [Curtobacterium flaccumfaciens pv. flaccumfaciens]
MTGPAATGSSGCTTRVAPNGSWACLGTVRSGPQQVFTVRDLVAALPVASAPASDVIVPPTLAAAGPTGGTVSGTGYPGSTVLLSVSGSSAQQTARVGADGRWVAALGSLADGRFTVTASQTASTARGYRSDLRSAASAPVTVTVDRTAPAAPRITSPDDGQRIGTRSTTVSGTGEPGARVTVYVDRAPVCGVVVASDASWSCSTAGSTLRAGGHQLTATQHDVAGNYSRSSAAVRVTVWSTTTAPTATPTPGATDTPGTPGTSTPGSGATTGTPGATGHGNGNGDGDGTNAAGHGGDGGNGGENGGAAGTGNGTGNGPSGGTGSTPAGVGSAGGHPDWSGPAGDWTAATTYDRTVPTIQAAFSWKTVLVATAVAAGFLLLIAAPLALVAAVTRGRLRSPFAGLLGRNRSRSDRARGDDVLPTWASITIAVSVAALCTLLGVGVELEARYARLAIAVLAGTGVLTAAVVFATRWAAGSDHRTIGFRVSPWLVLAALVACGVTRAADLSPRTHRRGRPRAVRPPRAGDRPAPPRYRDRRERPGCDLAGAGPPRTRRGRLGAAQPARGRWLLGVARVGVRHHAVRRRPRCRRRDPAARRGIRRQCTARRLPRSVRRARGGRRRADHRGLLGDDRHARRTGPARRHRRGLRGGGDRGPGLAAHRPARGPRLTRAGPPERRTAPRPGQKTHFRAGSRTAG